jgi:phosphoribosylformylglycinamidine synthase subunit PurSL
LLPDGEEIDGLLKSTIQAATEAIGADWVRSAFVDNAGVIAFDEEYDLSFKVETHNHPSAIEPFGGANTGVGGVVRDNLGVSHRPIAVTDMYCASALLTSCLKLFRRGSFTLAAYVLESWQG